MNGQSEVGTLIWNANGTLGQLAITDPFNTQNNQTCTNTYDDLARISGNSCTPSVWAQTFSYDPFGNVSKSGSISWACAGCYTPSTNQYNSTLSSLVSYDANGSLLNDTFNTYTWNAYGDLASANGAAVVYDAFDRMVENHGGTYEFAYAPTGTHSLAWLQGQTLSGAQLPLPGNAFAIYNGSGLAQYNHADWLGSARLFSTPTRSPSPAMSYAPFGEGYAGGIQDIQFTSFSSSFTVSGTESQGGTLDDFTFRRYSPVQGRWISPDPAGLGAVNPANPQTWNRYAYVANNPLSYVDPLGLQQKGPGGNGCNSEEYNCGSGGADGAGGGGWAYIMLGWTELGGSWGFWINFGGQRSPCTNYQDCGANSDVNKTWSKTFACNKSATQVMSAVQSDMGQFADNQGPFFGAYFPDQPITMGGQYTIQPGVMNNTANMFGSTSGGMFPVANLVVTVTSQSSNGWTFTTDPAHHYFDGTVSFSANDAGSGNISFSITATANYSGFVSSFFGPIIKAGEDSTWNNMLSNIQGYCQSPTGN